MRKKILSLVLASLLLISSFSLAYGVITHADKFEDEIFNDLLSSERDVYGDIINTYISLENKDLITSVVRQFIGDARYEDYDFLLEFVDEDFVRDEENIGFYVSNGNALGFKASFNDWADFNTYLEVMNQDLMSTYISRFSVSLYYLNTAKYDREIAGFGSNIFRENSAGDISVIDAVYEEGGMYDTAKDFIERIDFNFPDRTTAKSSAENTAYDYNNASKSDQEIIFGFLDEYNLVDEYRSSSGDDPREDEIPTVLVEEDTLNKNIETSDDDRVIVEYIYEDSEDKEDKVDFIIEPEVLTRTGYYENKAVKLVFKGMELVISGDSFEDEGLTKVSLEKTDEDSYIIDSDNKLSSPVFIDIPYNGVVEYPGVYRYDKDIDDYDLIGGYFDKEAGVVKFAVSSFSEFVVEKSEAAIFEDIDDITWGEDYKDAVRRMSAAGYVNGRGELFDPFAEVTRAEFSAMLVRLLDAKGQLVDTTFKDVFMEDWFFDEVGSAYGLGLVKGVSEFEFKPNEKITREEMAVMVSRMLKYKYYIEGYNELNGVFIDEELIDSWARDGVALVEKLGVMNGRTSGEFDPKSYTTRLEAVLVMERLLSK